MDPAGSRPSSRLTIMVRFAHGQARETTSRYLPASTGSVPPLPPSVIRPFRYRVSRTNSPAALTPPTLPPPPPPPPAPPAGAPPSPPPDSRAHPAGATRRPPPHSRAHRPVPAPLPTPTGTVAMPCRT